MTAELGESRDPKELVPGDPVSLDQKVSELRKKGEQYVTVHDDLGNMDVGEWVGQAGDSFRASFSKEPPKWMAVRESLNSVSSALLDYTETLRWAQNQAGEAVTLWEKGAEQDQRDPSPTHAANAASSSAQAGDRYRRQASELLSRARRELDAAGTRAAAKIRGGAQSSGALDSMVEAITEGWSAQGKNSTSGPGAGWSASWPKGEKMGELKAFAQLAKASAEGSLSNGPFKLSGKAAATVAAEASLSGAVTNEGIAAKAEVMAGGKATAQGKAELGPYVGYNGKVEAFAGAKASVSGSVGTDGLHANAGAFAGAKVTGKAGGDVGGIGINATAEGWAGAGAEAGVHFGADESGKWSAGFNLGASPYVGGKVGFELTVDPKDVADTATDAAQFAKDTAQSVGEVAGSTWDTVTETFE